MNLDSSFPQSVSALADSHPLGVQIIGEILAEERLAGLAAGLADLWQRFPAQSMVHYGLLLAAERHAGQEYEQLDGPTPYLAHLIDVSRYAVVELSAADPITAVCALWHDMIEDGCIREEALRDYVNNTSAFGSAGSAGATADQILAILHPLIRPAAYDAAVYYGRLAAAPDTARLVKAADLMANSSTLMTMHQATYEQLQPGLPFRDHLIPKYLSEVTNFVLEQPAFTSLPPYPIVHNTLLAIFRPLVNYLTTRFPEQIHQLDVLAQEKYGADFRQALNRLGQIAPCHIPAVLR